MTVPRRGDIFLVEFDPTRGHEIRKTRPALIIQNNLGNWYSQVTIVAAITSKLSPVSHPVEVVNRPSRTNGLVAESAILLDQNRSIDRERLVRCLGAIDPVALRRVDDAILISLGLMVV